MIDQLAVTAFARVAIISAFTGIVRWSQRQLGGASSASLQPLPFSAALWQKRLSLMWVNRNGSSLAWSMVVWLIQSFHEDSLVSHIEGFILSFIHLATSGFARAARSSAPSTFSIQSTVNESFASEDVSLIHCIHPAFVLWALRIISRRNAPATHLSFPFFQTAFHASRL